MTNAAKASVWDVIYTPWGAFHSATGAQTLNTRCFFVCLPPAGRPVVPGARMRVGIRSASQEQAACITTGTGMQLAPAKAGDPSLGRYTQPDPLGFVDGPSVYAYAKNSPTTFVDRNGQFVQLLFIALPELLTATTTIAVWLTLPDPPPIPAPNPPQSYPEKTDQCNGDDECQRATNYQLRKANITDQHDFKNEWDAKPNSRFDICACKDGSIRIKAQGQCGSPGPSTITDRTWK